MARLAIFFGLLLIAVGLVGYFQPDLFGAYDQTKISPTALIPAFIGAGDRAVRSAHRGHAELTQTRHARRGSAWRVRLPRRLHAAQEFGVQYEQGVGRVRRLAQRHLPGVHHSLR